MDRLWEADVPSPDVGSLADEWELKDGGRLSSPVIAEGLALVAAVDGQRVRAFDAASGTPRWSSADRPPRTLSVRVSRRMGLLPPRR